MSYQEEYQRWLDSPALSTAEWEELKAIENNPKEIEDVEHAVLPHDGEGKPFGVCHGLDHVLAGGLIDDHGEHIAHENTQEDGDDLGHALAPHVEADDGDDGHDGNQPVGVAVVDRGRGERRCARQHRLGQESQGQGR